MNTILDLICNHTGLLILLYLLLTALLMVRRRRIENRIMQYLVLILWVIATAYLAIFGRTPVMEVRCNLIPFRDGSLANIKNNVLLFVPLVPVLCGLFEKMTVKTAVFYGILASVVIELAQLISRRGICDIDDVLENSLGVLIGAGFLMLLGRLIRHTES